MTEEQVELLMDEVKRLWPRKYTPSELEDFCQRFEGYGFAAVCAALSAHKDSRTNRPAVSEIKDRLGRNRAGGGSTATDVTFAATLRREWGAPEPDTAEQPNADRRTYLIHGRKLWRRFALKWLALRKDQPDAVCRELEARAASVTLTVKTDLARHLGSTGLGRDAAVQLADWVDAENFHTVLAETGAETADAFAGEHV